MLKTFINYLIFSTPLYALVRFIVLKLRKFYKSLYYDDFVSLLNELQKNGYKYKDFDLNGKKLYFLQSILDARYRHMYNLLSVKSVKFIKQADFAIIWGRGFKYVSYQTLKKAKKLGIPVFIAEDGFLRSVDLGINGEIGLSVHVDLVGGIYYDARTPSVIETTLNDADYKLSKQQEQLANDAMEAIKANAISKYNLVMPQADIKIGTPGKHKVLVLDQRYGDQSIPASLSNPQRFIEMLDSAIKENPGSEIILKVHPDVITGGLKGHYKDLDKRDDIILLTENYNPVSLINYVDKVYTVSSGMGFEALICGKPVVCFGVPFYSNWGLTDDRIKLERRTKKRTLQEVFYAAYIKYSYYYNDNSNSASDIFDVISRLVDKRSEKLNNN